MKTRTNSNRQSPGRSQRNGATQRRGQLKRGKFTMKKQTWPDERTVTFPQVKGKRMEKIELRTSADYHAITLEFQDKTSVGFEIQPGFTVQAAYADFKTGESRVKTWPEIVSHRQ
jgi:hypothetical protein